MKNQGTKPVKLFPTANFGYHIPAVHKAMVEVKKTINAQNETIENQKEKIRQLQEKIEKMQEQIFQNAIQMHMVEVPSMNEAQESLIINNFRMSQGKEPIPYESHDSIEYSEEQTKIIGSNPRLTKESFLAEEENKTDKKINIDSDIDELFNSIGLDGNSNFNIIE